MREGRGWYGSVSITTQCQVGEGTATSTNETANYCFLDAMKFNYYS